VEERYKDQPHSFASMIGRRKRKKKEEGGVTPYCVFATNRRKEGNTIVGVAQRARKHGRRDRTCGGERECEKNRNVEPDIVADQGGKGRMSRRFARKRKIKTLLQASTGEGKKRKAGYLLAAERTKELDVYCVITAGKGREGTEDGRTPHLHVRGERKKE